jgi:hypothetical protein
MSDKTAATTYAKLRTETAAMLGFGEVTLTAAQAMKVDLVTALRLGLDDLSGRLAAGERVDLGKLLEASEALLQFLPANVAAPPSPGGPDGLFAARKRMAELLGIAEIWNETPSEEEARRRAELDDLKRCIADYENEIFDLKKQLEIRTTPAPAPSPSSPPSSQPQQQPASNNVVPIRDQLLISPVVIGESTSIFEQLNRKSW